MKEVVEDIYNTNRLLLGEGYDNALEYLKHLIDLEIMEFPSGTEVGTWTVPQEWVIRDAYLKYKDKKIVDYSENPLSLMVGSCPIDEKITGEELKKHLYVPTQNFIELSTCPDCNREGIDEEDEIREYAFHYYGDKEWGFSLSEEEWNEYEDIIDDKRRKFEVFVDSEFKDGTMKIATHTIEGKTDKEILLFAHLDHPFMANDNLSGVATLVDIAGKIEKMGFEHTIKIVFCPETIGSNIYALTQDLSKVDFVMSLDIVGNDNMILVSRAFDRTAKLNFAANLALKGLGIDHRMSEFRHLIGSEEYAFNDPEIGIPGVLVTRFPYPEYHTCADKPDIIDEEKLEEVQMFVLKTIEIMERDFAPERKFKGPLFREKFGVQTTSKQFNRNLDYFIYYINGERSVIDLCQTAGVGFDFAYELLTKLRDANLISDFSKREKPPLTKEEFKKL